MQERARTYVGYCLYIFLLLFEAHWHARHDDLVLTGSMGRPREIEAWRAGTALERLELRRRAVKKVYSY